MEDEQYAANTAYLEHVTYFGRFAKLCIKKLQNLQTGKRQAVLQ